MPRLLLSLAALLIIQGCYASAGFEEEEDEPLPALLVDECVATASPWHDPNEDPSELPDHVLPADAVLLPGTVLIWANYPLFSPDYSLETYVSPLIVEIDEELESRIDLVNPSWETSLPMVLGRMDGDEAWRVLTAPDVSCPPRPAGVEWPVSR